LAVCIQLRAPCQVATFANATGLYRVMQRVQRSWLGAHAFAFEHSVVAGRQ